ncbi:hypothetical protein C2G38_2222683 [Gigaspora rosea]|uniref:Sodium/calcium exchanger membrane region domain-containing protein n=1 Tax=Gigaspora rosea TaxID=44941 RepID=A0A397U5C0_9GLOM|nr:hypothetical protein C2G38_2222683 [Gigaspora rosea]CAG8507034.1 15992_t:CDS:1 [Gigaspora rosea]
MSPIKDIEAQLFKNNHFNKTFSLFKRIGNGKFWLGFLLEVILAIVILVINIYWENEWFDLVISSLNLLLFAYIMNKCVEGMAERSSNFLTGLINNMGGNIAELFTVIIFMKSNQALLAGFTIIGSAISTVLIVPALAVTISIYRNGSLRPFKFNAIDAQNMLINLYVLSFVLILLTTFKYVNPNSDDRVLTIILVSLTLVSYLFFMLTDFFYKKKPRVENEFYIRIKEENNTENNEENNIENNIENNNENENNEENNTENNTENIKIKDDFKDLLKRSKFIITDEIKEISQDENDTNEKHLENDDKIEKKSSSIELIILIILFAITCAGFYFVGEIFSESLQKTPLYERLAFVGIFFTPAMLDVPEHLNTISLFKKNTDLAMITSFGSSCQIIGFVYPIGTLISVGLGANPNIPFPPDFVGIYFLVIILAYNIINDGKFTLHEGLSLFATTAMVGVYSFFRVI